MGRDGSEGLIDGSWEIEILPRDYFFLFRGFQPCLIASATFSNRSRAPSDLNFRTEPSLIFSFFFPIFIFLLSPRFQRMFEIFAGY